MCMTCSRLREGLVCEAYPDGIPEEILDNRVDHRVPQPGDRGLHYEPQEGAEPEKWWPEEKLEA